jgi:hypothetical protein
MKKRREFSANVCLIRLMTISLSGKFEDEGEEYLKRRSNVSAFKY